MKRCLLLLLTLMIICNIAKSQTNTWVAPGNYMAATISSASFINANSGWVVGSGGIIYATTNGGTSWTAQSSGTTNALSAVHFVNATHGWAVGASGTILATVNGGSTWTTQNSGLSVTLTGVRFVSTTVGWAIGSSGNILATLDGGATWTPQVSGVSIALSSIYFLNATQGWIAGAGGNILSTSNGGATWSAQVTGTVSNLSGIYFANATQGWAVGALGTILTSSNGGTTWTRQTSGSTNALSAVHFINANQGWAVGAAGTILTTTNGGTNWSTIASGTTNTLSFVYFNNANKGFVGGINIVLSTINGGTNWSTSLSGTTSILRSVYFLNSTMCWAAGSGPTIIASTNGGATWTKQTIPTKAQVYGICFANTNQGWAIDVIGQIISTSNGGTTWTQQTSPTTNALSSVYFISGTQGWAVGASGTIIATTNGGTTWTQQTSPTANNLTGVHFVSSTQGWAVGAAGTIVTTNNGGATWAIQTSPTGFQLNSISMYSATQGWAVGNNGTILTTKNGGSSWAIQTSSTTNQLTSVHFTSAKQGWAVGLTGTILTTNDGGITWIVQTSGTTQPLYGVSFNNSTLQGCAVGNGGTILLYNPNDTAIKAPVIGSFSPTTATTGSTVTIKGNYFTGTTDISFGGTSASSFTVLNDSTITAVLTNGSSGDVVVTNTIGSSSLAGFVYGGAGKTYTWTRPSNYINCTLTNANFVNVTQAWAVGSNGTILATNDGGTTWASQASGKTTTLNSTYFYNANIGCAVGVSGVILTTSDGGKTWISRNSGIGISLASAFFISPTQGWVAGVGGNILTTTDSGATWTAQASGTTNNLTKIYFISSTIGWALGANGTILSTIDGGNTWNTQVSNTVSNLTGISFLNANVGWVAGTGYFLSTNNGGQTWNTRIIGNSLSVVYMASATKGWGLGTNGNIITTTNGGTTWKTQTSGSVYNLTGIYFADSTQGHVVGISGSNISTFTTIDGGTNWSSQTLVGNTAQLNSVNFSDSSNGWTVSSTGSILNSTNGGNTWQNQTSPSSTILGSVYFASPTQGWAVGNGSISSNIIATTNGGSTWAGQTSPITNQLYAVYFANTLTGWAVGATGSILNTTNGGATWAKQTSPVTNQLSSVYFINATHGWAVGNAGIILTTTDGGTNWVKQSSPTTNNLFGIHFINANQGWAVGGLNGVSGTILTTSNGGTTWTVQTSGTINLLNSVHFISSTQGWVVGNNGTILTTTNGGVTWVAQASGTTNNLLGVDFNPSTQQGWAVGANGQILLYNAANVNVAPKVTSFSPTTAATGTSVIIKGTAFKGTTSVSFGGTSAKSFIVINDSTINAMVGNGADGSVTVTNAGGTSSLTGFNYMYYVNVTFNVDITNYLKAGNVLGKNGIRIAGAFASIGAKSLPDWLPSSAACAMTQGANNIWSIKVSIPDTSIGKSLLYKFVNNDWGQNEGVDVSNTILNCGVSDGLGNINRLLVLPTVDSTLSFCWDQCSACNLIATLPSVTTYSAQNVTLSSATLSGNLTSNGGDVVNEEGIVYSTSPNPTTQNSLFQFWTSPLNGVFSYTQTGLQPNTTYYFRAFAANSVGTVYGNQLVFTTLKPCPVVVTNMINLNGCGSIVYKGVTYTVSTVRNDTLRNSIGCDSIYTIANLQVLQPTSSTTTMSICAGSSYAFNGNTYTQAGTYIVHLTNSVGCDSAATLVLSILPSSSSTTNAIICTGSSYLFNGTSYSQAGSYVAHLTNSLGCDSTATLNLSIKSQSTSTTNVSICDGNSYTFNGTTYTTSGSYVAHLTNSIGCDSAATLNLSIKSPTSSITNVSICQGGSYSFNGTTYTSAGSYVAHLINSVGCDSAATINISFKSNSTSSTNVSICQGGSYIFNGNVYNTAGIYTAHLTNSVGCDSAATLNLSVKSPTTSTTNVSICQGDSYSFNGTVYTTAVTYTAHLLNSLGCDSAATLNLTIKTPTSSTTNASICQGGSYTFNGTVYTTAGIYTAHLTNSIGCDSTATLNLSIKSPSSSITNVSICQGGSYSFNGKVYTTSGTYFANLTNSIGCDSVATLVLTVKSTSSSITYLTICSENSYNFNGITYTKSGSYTAHLLNSLGCDSAATLVLTVSSTSSTTYASICKGNNYYFNGSIYSVGGTYTAHLTNSVGCDSSANLVLSVNQPTTSTTVVNTCSGKSYYFNGVFYSSTGTYTTHLANSAGCDSAATLILTVNKPTSSNTTASICSGSSYFFNGTTYSKAGNYTIHLINAGGCDSLATLSLTVLASSSSTTNISICEGDSYTFNGTDYSTTGTYTAHLPNAVGCDSAATLILTVNSLSTSTTNKSICIGSSYTFNGSTYSIAGTYTSHLINAAGCDSAATLILTVNVPSSSITNASICAGSTYTFNGTTYTKAGSYTAHLNNAVGCDSAATLNLSIKATSVSTTTTSICAGGSYTFNGTSYTKAGSYTSHLTNSLGCDSAATLVLTVKATSTSTSNMSICAGGTYTFNGTTYSKSGSYTAHLTNSVGCDSAATLVLTVKSTSVSTTNMTICAGSSYTFNGSTYTKAGSYTAHLINAVGCDSAATLVLTVKQTSFSTTNASICGGGSYTFNGITYTTAGNYTAHLINAVGCDSAATLVLTVNSPSSSIANASICSGSSYTFNGTTYTQAGSYTAHLTNAVGCDSAASLVLTIKQTSISTTNASICNGGSYTFNGITYATAGSYTAHLINSVGCDSAATLILTVKSNTASTTNASICAGDSYTFNGSTYTTSGSYTAHLINAVGCDSAATLILTVKQTSASTTNASICIGGFYTFNGSSYSQAGSYTIHLTNAVGCDSAATLVLIVNTPNTSTTNASICAGNSYTFNGTTYIRAGTYTAHLTNVAGCDSAATLILTLKATSTSTTNMSICAGSSYTFNGFTYTQAGSYRVHLTNAVGCDSAATLVLTVKPTTTSTTNMSICAGGTYTFNGTTYSKSGSYTAHLTNSVGCDSAATLILTVKATSTSTTNASICNGSSYTFNGTSYSQAGNYIVHLTNSVGCDSAATLVLTVNSPSSSTTNANICTGSSYAFNGTTYTTAGTYLAHLTNSVGCDSAATLVLTVYSPTTSTTNASICTGSSYAFNGSTYTQTGSYTAHLTNVAGCDSAATLILTLKATSTSTTNMSICAGSSYTFNGSTYTQAGSYRVHLTNAVGCDSAATLVLTVKATSTSTSNMSICAGSSYTFNGISYSKTGIYVAHLTNAVGCDSTATLILTVKPTSTSSTNASICSGSSYIFNGTSYSQAGNYIVHLTNSVGCDSAATLVLTVNSPSSSTTNANICTGSSYAFNGTTYTTAGTYTAHLTNSVGCDSTATLVLKVNSPTTSTTIASICTGSSYAFNGSTYSQAGSFIAHLTNAAGCDSAATLVLTVKTVSNSTTNASICSGDSYTFNGTSYSTAGTFTAHLTNSLGCDSAATLILTVKATSSSITNASINLGENYSFNGTTYTTSGTYSVHLINAVGCDSIATLNLTVNSNYTISGNIKSPLGTIIPSVTVSLNGNQNLTTDANGIYSFTAAANSNNVILPSKNNDKTIANGVNGTDISLIQSHILKKVILNSPYKLIAADVNSDGSVNGTDIALIKSLILKRITKFAGNKLWSFVDSSYKFPVPTKPFPFNDSINIASINANQTGKNFIGVKLGDVNYDWNSAVLGIDSRAKPIELFNDNISINNTTTEVRVPIKVKNFRNIMGMQYTLNFNSDVFELKAIENNKLAADYNLDFASEGKLPILWVDAASEARTLTDSTVLFELVFNKKSNCSNETISLSSDITAINAFDGNYNTVGIKKVSGMITESGMTTNNFVVYPNPAKDNVTIKGAHISAVQVIDNFGKVVKLLSLKDASNPTLQVGGLTSGGYHLRIMTADGKVNIANFIKD